MTTITVTPEMIPDIIEEAKAAARNASNKFFNETLNGQDNYPCGFAWTEVYGIKGNTKIGKAFQANGFRKSYTSSAYQLWNPSEYKGQNMDVREAGAEAAANVLRKYGFKAYASSRMD